MNLMMRVKCMAGDTPLLPREGDAHCCPCCGFPGLEWPAYKNLGPPPWKSHGEPPYCQRYGDASYDVCECCGYEFGFEDNPGLGCQPISFRDYRTQWIAEGCEWFCGDRRPPYWSLREQLKRIGVDI
ncbi:MAG: hypothetical protein NTW19_10635 [Planctomycetota bacterium]|nr:hypothetical protein [Planctomycetota bacterium]